ncbi:hypothetical protein [Glycomyces sp. NPDC021274]|uniref:hypothetical protein n=1 Tax=Glycomyces sp. NPDC021274 TaxID=3155120 RepID=UPI0033F4CF9E
MELKQSFKQAGLLGLAAAAGLAGSLAIASAAQAEVVTIAINDGNIPTTAAGFENHSCDQVPTMGAHPNDGLEGWVFVLPSSAGADGNFISVEATFKDAEGNEYTYEAVDPDGGIIEGSGNNKAYIVTGEGLTLVAATAEVENPSEGAFFNLTHTCPEDHEDTPSGEPSSPGEEPSSPGEEPSSPGEESSPVCEEPSSPEASASASPSTPAGSESPCEEATSPAGNGNLPTTGTPLTIALVSAAALAAGGAALFMIMRRRREAQDW